MIKEEVVLHRIENGRYRVVFERSALKGVDGFKVEANGDEISDVSESARELYLYAQNQTQPMVIIE